MAAGVLQQFTYALGDRLHRRVHGAAGPGGCRFDPDAHAPPVRIDRGNPGAWSPAASVRVWTERFGTVLAAGHDLVVERARQRLGHTLGQRTRMRQVARELACSVPVLRRRFVSRAGETPCRYRIRLRAIEAVRLVRSTRWKMEVIARTMGWKSRKDLYRTLEELTGLTPGAIRALSGADAATVLARMGGPREHENTSP